MGDAEDYDFATPVSTSSRPRVDKLPEVPDGQSLGLASKADFSYWHDDRGTKYVKQDKDYLTTHELAHELDMYPETVFRWCRKWFGPLPKGRVGAKAGYRIPLEYRYVARGWKMTEDPNIREALRLAIVDSPKDWVVVVANLGSTHYSVGEVVGRMESLVSSPTYRQHVISVVYVGPIQTER